jgi:DNA polymerase-3 subunit delta
LLIDPAGIGTQLSGDPSPVFLIGGDEALLAEEAADSLRAWARTAGFEDRQVLEVERGFDWQQLAAAASAMSLFSTRRLIELRLPTGRPGDAGAKALVAYCQAPPPDTLLLVRTGGLDRSARNTRWFKALDKAGVVVLARRVRPEELPAWIRARLRTRQLSAPAEVEQLLAHRFEGNLLAVAQEIDKLALLLGTQLDIDPVTAALAEDARFDVFALVDGCLAGHGARCVRILGGLRAEGAEPVLVVWALARELRKLAGIAAELAAGRPQGEVLRSHGVWSSRQALVGKALRRVPTHRWPGWLSWLARIDRTIKGWREGDVWLELEQLSLAICGTRGLVR